MFDCVCVRVVFIACVCYLLEDRCYLNFIHLEFSLFIVALDLGREALDTLSSPFLISMRYGMACAANPVDKF